MAQTYVWQDGQRVTPLVKYRFLQMKRAFDAKRFRDSLGRLVTLKITSGTRTTQEQINTFLARYVPVNQVNGRHVYDYRWWNGTHYARISSAGTVAQPGTSNHEESGPIGPRAIDIGDTGSDQGVAYANNERSNWIRSNAGRFGFNTAGYGFGEPWHLEFSSNPWAGAPNTGDDDVVTRNEMNQIADIVVDKMLGYRMHGGGDDLVPTQSLAERLRFIARQGRVTYDAVRVGEPGKRSDGALTREVKLAADRSRKAVIEGRARGKLIEAIAGKSQLTAKQVEKIITEALAEAEGDDILEGEPYSLVEVFAPQPEDEQAADDADGSQ